jgi:Cft2 family RNA processing exonuclease
VSALRIQYDRGGVHLPELGLWLDPAQRQSGPEKVFVSHAHSDHIAAHREVILTAPTARLMHSRLGGRRVEHVLPLGEPRALDGGRVPYQLTLLPAGHILGSAMVWIEADGESLLYTGDFKLRPGLCAERCEPRAADLLIMETTFGQPEYEFPPAPGVMEQIIRFCREALAGDATPALLCYSLGKSQELLAGLAGAGLPVALHEATHKITRIYEQFGCRFPAYECLEANGARRQVVICPPHSGAARALRRRVNTRAAIITGWALDPRCRYRYQADAAFPLSDHADFPELIEMVGRVAPKKVYTLHGCAADFAQTVRDLGIDAQALSEPEQFFLALGRKGARSGEASNDNTPRSR